MSIKVLLADDHKIMREGLKSLLDDASDIQVVGLAANGREAVQLTTELQPDVVVMDLNMPEMDGITATRQLVAENVDAKVLILSMVNDRTCILECLKAGAKGYLLKDCAAEELQTAISALAHGESFLCTKVTQVVISEYAQRDRVEVEPTTAAVLSRREQEVLSMIADGKNTKEVAFVLDCSVKTVEVHRANIMKKLNLYSVAELTKYALREGLTTIDD
jgi:DNA-binding NarL/FixJ family response regulator